MGHDPTRPGPALVAPLSHEPRLLSQNTFSMLAPGSTDWEEGTSPNQGTLGESPMLFLGLYDLKPEQGFPPNQGILSKDWKAMQQVWGAPVFRLATNATKRVSGTNIFGTSLQVDQNLYRFASLSLVFSAWDNTDGEVVWPGRKANPADPEKNPGRLNQVTNQAWMGPNLLPSLTGQSVMSVDLRHWTRGARFVGVWLWPFWAGVTTPPDMNFVWEMWDERPSRDSWQQAWCISWPSRLLNTGPIIDPPAAADMIFRWGPLPGASGYRLGVLNGGNQAIRFVWQRFVGQAFVSHASNLAVGANQVLPVFNAGAGGTDLIYGITHHMVCAASQSPQNLGGPVIISLSAGPYGL